VRRSGKSQRDCKERKQGVDEELNREGTRVLEGGAQEWIQGCVRRGKKGLEKAKATRTSPIGDVLVSEKKKETTPRQERTGGKELAG